jgi:DNA-directed RNA polymerase subunit F
MENESTDNFVSLAEVKNILKKLEKEREDLTYEQRIALEHAHAFSKLTIKQTKDLIKELNEIGSIENIHAYKIADLLPTNEDAVKAIFAKERMNIIDGDIKKILNIVNKYYVE